MSKEQWQLTDWAGLDTQQWHDIVALRIAIFVVEQDCPYQDVDGRDMSAMHLSCVIDDELMAYLRFFAPNEAGVAVIGRVVVNESARGRGLGHRLMARGVQEVLDRYGPVVIHLSAQEHLRAYYGAHGFVQSGEGYLEDGIPHIPMDRPING